MSGRLTDTEVEALQKVGQSGRLTDTEVEALLTDTLPPVGKIGPGGWGFIPIGVRIDRSVYTDTYQDGY